MSPCTILYFISIFILNVNGLKSELEYRLLYLKFNVVLSIFKAVSVKIFLLYDIPVLFTDTFLKLLYLCFQEF